MNGNFQRALVLLEHSRSKEAQEYLRKSLNDEPNHADSHAYLGLCLVHEQKYEEALKEIREALLLSPNDAFGYYAYACLLKRQGKPKDAMKSIEAALSLDPDNSGYFAFAAEIEFEKLSYGKALHYLDQGLRFDARNISCHTLRARTLLRLGQKEKSDEAILQAMRLRPDDATVLWQLGVIRLEMGDAKKAKDTFIDALRINPSLDEAREGLLLALKSKYTIYRGLLQIIYWTQKHKGTAFFFNGVSFYIAVQFLKSLLRTDSSLVPFALVIVGILALPFIFTLFVDPIFSVIIQSDRLGRLSSNDKEKIDFRILFYFIGGIVLVTLILIVCKLIGILPNSV